MTSAEVITFKPRQPAPDKPRAARSRKRKPVLPCATVTPAVKIAYDQRMTLLGITRAQVNLIWRQLFLRFKRDEEAIRAWSTIMDRVAKVQGEYEELLTIERNLILTSAFRFYPRMAKRILAGIAKNTRQPKGKR